MLGKRPFASKSDDMDKYLDEEAKRRGPIGGVAPPPSPVEDLPGGEPVVATKSSR